MTVKGNSGTFTLSVPEGWSESTSGTVTTYTDKLNSVSVEETAASAAPTVDSARASAVPAILAARSNTSDAKVSTFAARGGSGIHIAFTADSAADPVTGTTRPDAIEVYQFWMSGKQVAVTLEGPTTADNVDPWKIVTDSLLLDRQMSDPVLEVTEIYRFFRSGEDETMALRGVSLTVSAGEFVAVVGPSGSGKSTLLSCAAGLDEPAGGTVRVRGERMSHRPEIERSRLRASAIGMLLQSGNLIGHLDVAANIRLAGRLVGNRRPAVASLLDSVGLTHRARAVPSELSGGESSRAGLAVALANRPPLLLADEPTGELDLEAEAVVLGLLRRHAEQGGGVLVVTHSQRVQDAADRVVRLADGRIIE